MKVLQITEDAAEKAKKEAEEKAHLIIIEAKRKSG